MRLLFALLAIATALAGCSMLDDKKIDYKSAGTLPPLEAPPDLLLPSGDSRYVVPDTVAKGQATYSAYTQDRGLKQTAEGAQILPKVDKARIERSGTQRWLVVDLPPARVWPVVKDFWQEMGFLVNVEMPDAGVMETDWAENRAKIPQDAIRGFLGKVLDSFYSTAERDKFRTRLEPAADGQGTEIYISHRGMYEVFEGTQGGGDQGTGRTVWQPRAADPELEAEMLRRLMTRFGIEEARAQTLLAEGGKAQPQAVQFQAADGSAGLRLPEPFDRAWRRVGLALDRIGFVVEDRDRAAGTYFVRYADPEAGVKQDKGFLSKLAFWRDDEKKLKEQRYQVKVAGQGERTEVTVHGDKGAPAPTDTGKRIASLLFEQLK